MALTIPSDGRTANTTNDIPLQLTKLVVSGFADNAPPAGNLFVELEVDGTHRQRCVVEWQSTGIVVSDSPSDVTLMINPSSLVDCELWYESEDKVYLDKLCECTVKITEAICQPGNQCEHKSGKHEWTFELHGSSVNEYELPANVNEQAEGLVDELRQTFKSLHEVSGHIPRLSGDEWMRQEEFNVAWQFFSYAYRNYHEAAIQSNRAALDDAVKDTLTQLRLGLDAFASRAKYSETSNRALHWSDGLDLVSQSVIQAAAFLDKYTRDLSSASSRMRSLFLDRCTQLQEDIIRFRLMFIQNGNSAKPLERDMTTDTLSMLVGYLVSSLEYDDVLLSLRGRQAGRALELLQEEIPNAPNEVRQRLRSLLTQVAQLSDRIPPSLFLDGVKWNAEVISRTKFSDVNSGVYKKERVVIKRIKLPIKNIVTDNSEKTKKSLLRALAWKTLKHDHLLPFLGVAVRKPGKDSDGLHLVSPRMELSNVLNVLGKKGSVDEDVLALTHRWMLEIAEGMAYLHNENIVHGDLRARNILVDRHYSVHISDFGLPALAEEAGVNYMAAHPNLVRWLAPELLSCDPLHMPAKQTLASDVYAFACVCVELYTCNVPFARTPDKQIAALVKKGVQPERPPTPGNDSAPMVEDLWNIIQPCWAAGADIRPTAAAIVEGLSTFLHGSNTERHDEPASTDVPESDREEITSRSGSPATVSSESHLDTPIDTPVMNTRVPRAVRTQSVEDYSPIVQVLPAKPRRGAFPDDIPPPPPYQAVDPTRRAAEQKDLAESSVTSSEERQDTTSNGDLSTEHTSEQEQHTPTVPNTESQEVDKVEETPIPITTSNETKEESTPSPAPPVEELIHDTNRNQNANEQIKSVENIATSQVNHDEHAETIVHDTQRVDEDKKETQLDGDAVVPENPVQLPTIPERTISDPAQPQPEEDKPTTPESSADSAVQQVVNTGKAFFQSWFGGDVAPSVPEAAPVVKESIVDSPAEHATTSVVTDEPLPISSDTVKESVTEPAAEENTTVDDETFYDARRGATVDFLAASPTAAPEVKDVETASSGRQVAVSMVTEGVTPATPEPLVQLPSVAETENIISDPVQPPTPVEEEHAAVAGTTSEVAQDSKRTSILVAEPLPVPNVPDVSTTCDECEAAQVTDGGSEAKASAAPERDGQLPSPSPAATEQAAEPTLSPASTAEQKTEPVETSASSVNTQDTHPMGTVMSTASAPAPATTPAQDAEGKQTRVEHDSSEHTTEGKGSDDGTGTHEEASVATTPDHEEHAASASEPTHAAAAQPPATVEATQEVAQDGQHAVQVPAIKTPVAFVASESSPAPDSSTETDSELAPRPNLAMQVDSMARRASIRLVNPPNISSSTEEELPALAGLPEAPHEEAPPPVVAPAPVPAPAPAPVADDGIEVKDRVEQPAVPQEQQVVPAAPAKESAPKTAAPAPKSKGKKKKGKKNADDPEMHKGRCASCLIM